MMKSGSIALLVLLGTAGAAEARLVRQGLNGVWRECIYQVRPRAGGTNPRQRLGAPAEQVYRVGRGEPCPATAPSARPLRRNRGSTINAPIDVPPR